MPGAKSRRKLLATHDLRYSGFFRKNSALQSSRDEGSPGSHVVGTAAARERGRSLLGLTLGPNSDRRDFWGLPSA